MNYKWYFLNQISQCHYGVRRTSLHFFVSQILDKEENQRFFKVNNFEKKAFPILHLRKAFPFRLDRQFACSDRSHLD
jgi:hypothetical protein